MMRKVQVGGRELLAQWVEQDVGKCETAFMMPFDSADVYWLSPSSCGRESWDVYEEKEARTETLVWNEKKKPNAAIDRREM